MRTSGHHAANPYWVQLVPLACFFIAFFYNPGDWFDIFQEENYSFLNVRLLAYLIGIHATMTLGIWIGESVPVLKYRSADKYIRSKTEFDVILIATLLGVTAVFFAYIYYLIAFHPRFILLTISGEANTAKQLLVSGEVKFTTLPHFAMGLVWWAWYMHLEYRRKYPQSILLKFLLYVSISLILIVSVINAARYVVMPLLIGLFVIYIKQEKFKGKRVSRHLFMSLKYYAYLSAAVLLAFSFFSLTRGYVNYDEMYQMILGYGPVSYNRLASVLSGNLRFEYSPTLTYLFPEPFFSLIRSFFGFEHLTSYDIWMSEFEGVELAGLNRNFIWLSVPGYVYDSIGLYSFLYFLFYGLIVGFAWQSFMKMKLWGVIFYPLAYFSLFFFYGSNYLFQMFPYYLSAYILLSLYSFAVRQFKFS